MADLTHFWKRSNLLIVINHHIENEGVKSMEIMN